VAVPLEVGVELPSRGPIGGIDIRAREPVYLLFEPSSQNAARDEAAVPGEQVSTMTMADARNVTVFGQAIARRGLHRPSPDAYGIRPVRAVVGLWVANW
jgi:hypothetical protein